MTSLQQPQMTPLPDHEFFEALLLKQQDERLKQIPTYAVVYFTASWCGACKRLNLPAIVGAFPQVTFYKCDVDENSYTLGYCGARSIPTFVTIQRGQLAGTLSNSNTEAVQEWLKSILK